RTATERDEHVREVDAAEQEPDRRHQDVFYERVDDLAEGGADDHADGEVDDVAPHRELFELFEHGSTPLWCVLVGSAAEQLLDRLERVDVLLEPVEMRLDVGDRGPELAGRAERAALVADIQTHLDG